MRSILLAALLLTPVAGSAGLWRPWWTREKPAIVTRRGQRMAIAVGYAKTGSEPLTRDAAQAQARKKLLELLGGGQEGYVNGAREARTYAAWRGGLYVELEAPLP